MSLRTRILFTCIAGLLPIGVSLGSILAHVAEPYPTTESFVYTVWCYAALITCASAGAVWIALRLVCPERPPESPRSRERARLADALLLVVFLFAFAWSVCFSLRVALSVGLEVYQNEWHLSAPAQLILDTAGSFYALGLLAIAAALSTCVIFRHTRSLSGVLERHCDNCGYDMKGLVQHCPECGLKLLDR